MARSVPVIQHHSPAVRFALIGFDDAGFEFAAASDDALDRVRLAGEHRIRILFQPTEEVRIEDDAVFDDLRQAATELPLGQGGEEASIDPDAGGLVDRADQVFPAG